MRTPIKLALTVLLAVTISGCTFNIGTSDRDKDNGKMGNGMMGNGASTSEFSNADIMFAQMMIPHHEQAIEMSTLAETQAANAKVIALAAQIKAEQSPEIKQMSAWLEAANAPTAMGHDMGMGGMLSNDQMTELENSTGAVFDKLYLLGMIQHHEGAIQMAEMVTDSKNSEVKLLAASIIDSQTKQINYMKTLLIDLGLN